MNIENILGMALYLGSEYWRWAALIILTRIFHVSNKMLTNGAAIA